MARVLEFSENVLAQLESADWAAAAVAVIVHLVNVVVRAHAWRNIVAAAYPAQRVGKRKLLVAYAAGAGVNALSPWRGGEVLRLSLARRHVSGSTYAGLASTMAAETVFNVFAATALLAWAVAQGAVPVPRVGPATMVGVSLAAVVIAAAVFCCRRHLVSSFGAGFRVFADPVAYFRDVAAWQALDWVLRLATIYWFMKAFGIGGGFEALLLIQGAQSAGTLLPFAPARIGTKQAVLAYILGSQVPPAALVMFVAGSEVLLASTNALLGVAAMMAALRTVRWRAALTPRLAPAEP